MKQQSAIGHFTCSYGVDKGRNGSRVGSTVLRSMYIRMYVPTVLYIQELLGGW